LYHQIQSPNHHQLYIESLLRRLLGGGGDGGRKDGLVGDFDFTSGSEFGSSDCCCPSCFLDISPITSTSCLNEGLSSDLYRKI